MTSRTPGSRPPRRMLTLVGVFAIALGAVTAGVPASALASAPEEPPAVGDQTPAPSDPAPVDPTPTPSATPTAVPTPEPSLPATPGGPVTGPSTPVPGTDAPTTPATPTTPTAPLTPTAPVAPVTPAAPTLPTLLGKVYPTNPWIYNGKPGTRFLDERQRDAGGQIVRRHLGIDAQGGPGQPIFAVADGVVVGGTWRTSPRDRHGFGNYIELAHSDGYTTLYAHFESAPLVQPGARVTAGQIIGYMGGSQRGNLDALARHLHFEVALNGAQIDPLVFLDGAQSASGAVAAAAAPDAVAAETFPLTQLRADDRGAYVATATGMSLSTTVFAAVETGGASADVFAGENGTLRRLSEVDGVWTESDTQLPLTATSISGASRVDGTIELFAVEDGKLVYIVGDAAGWTKTSTGHEFSGDVRAVRLPGGELHAMLSQAGYLYHLSPAAGGLWNVSDTRMQVGDEFDAVYVAGGAPDVMTIVDGEVTRILAGPVGWSAVSTGLSAAGRIAAVSDGTAWPTALTAGGDGLARTGVADGWWRQWVDPIAVTGAIDAVTGTGGTAVLYAVG